MFQNLIDRASSLIARLEALRAVEKKGKLGRLSPSQDIAWAEINGWFNASRDITSQTFGESSKQLQRWKDEWKELQELDRKEVLSREWIGTIDSLIRDFSTMRGLMIEFQEVWKAKCEKQKIDRENNMSGPITISGGIFVGSQIGGVANSMNTYIEQLRLSEYSTHEEKQLKEALANLRTEIEESNELTLSQKVAASTDLALLTDQLVKPPEKQDEHAKSLFWERLKSVLTVSSGLGNLLAVIAKLAGMQ